MSGFVLLNAGYTVSVHGTRLNALVLVTVVLAAESPTCILSRGYTHPVTGAIEVSHAALAKLSFDQKFLSGRCHS